MLQWNDGSWEHRAYWGANRIAWGVNNTESRYYKGALPATGRWVRLEVPASQVGLEGHVVNGMGFVLYGGRATWDHAGKFTPTSASAAASDDEVLLSSEPESDEVLPRPLGVESDPSDSSEVYFAPGEPSEGDGTSAITNTTAAPAPPPNATALETITLRGLGNQVLREYKVIGGDQINHWRWNKDYIYYSGRLLASEAPTGLRHYHLDHLGTPRLITDSAGNAIGPAYQYFPFGEEATAAPPADERLRFTGHERDMDRAGMQLDYMHARFYRAGFGKFLSVDPGRDWNLSLPQSWNMYTYVRNNPINATDPSGQDVAGLGAGFAALLSTQFGFHFFDDNREPIGLNHAPMSLSPGGLAHLKLEEGHARGGYGAYDDHATGKAAGTCVVGGTGDCTIGYGHNLLHGACTAADCAKYAGYTQAQADTLLVADVKVRETAVNRALSASVSQAKFDSLVLFHFNVRKGGVSRLNMAAINLGLDGGTAREIMQFTYSKGVQQPGLVKRRGWEAKAFERTYHVFP
jgi:RHS repeat-associated protein